MRVVVLVTVLLASSSLCPSFAQEAAKPPIVAPQTVPAQPDQRAERDRPRDDDREVGRDWRMRRGDSDRMSLTTMKWVRTGECTASATIIAEATRIADDTPTATIETIEDRTERAEARVTGRPMMKIDPAVG